LPQSASLSDSQAARLYAMVNVAMYDAVNGIIPLRTQALVPPTGAPQGANRYAAAAAAAHAVLSGEFPALKAALYDPQLRSDLAALPPGQLTEAGRRWGVAVGNMVRGLRVNDGSTPSQTQAAGAGPGQFRAAWSGVQFRDLMPFGIANSATYEGHGPPALNSAAYAAAFNDVKRVGDGRINDPASLATYQFWSLGGGTSQPPGAWIQVAVSVTDARPLLLAEKTRLFALVSMSSADTVAPTTQTKFNFRHWRPTTAIQEADTDGNADTIKDAGWVARAGQVGGTPEYWSGHSSFSGAAATALAGFYCNDNVSFTLRTDSAPGGVARTYPRFSAAALEAGQSRILGGLHFQFSNVEALVSGFGVAAEILAKKLLLRVGPTHQGVCPL